jgi:hypothetical protein
MVLIEKFNGYISNKEQSQEEVKCIALFSREWFQFVVIVRGLNYM